MTDNNGAAEEDTGPTPPPSPPLNWTRFREVVLERKIDFALWLTRLLTVFFAAGYIFPIFGSPVPFYYKAFMAGAATSALRLHQRLPPFSFTRAFFQQMVLEDSFHYLFCALIFIYATPMTMALVPSVLFAILHFASFSLTLLDALGRNSAWIARVFISLIEYKSVTILRMAAGSEICIMWFLICYALIGRHSLISPFLYFRFLTFRYSSRRNHYTRTMFYELRLILDGFTTHENCPSFVASAINTSISLMGRLAPQVPPAPAS